MFTPHSSRQVLCNFGPGFPKHVSFGDLCTKRDTASFRLNSSIHCNLFNRAFGVLSSSSSTDRDLAKAPALYQSIAGSVLDKIVVER